MMLAEDTRPHRGYLVPFGTAWRASNIVLVRTVARRSQWQATW
jgi:hypothetical protein